MNWLHTTQTLTAAVFVWFLDSWGIHCTHLWMFYWSPVLDLKTWCSLHLAVLFNVYIWTYHFPVVGLYWGHNEQSCHTLRASLNISCAGDWKKKIQLNWAQLLEAELTHWGFPYKSGLRLRLVGANLLFSLLACVFLVFLFEQIES